MGLDDVAVGGLGDRVVRVPGVGRFPQAQDAANFGGLLPRLFLKRTMAPRVAW